MSNRLANETSPYLLQHAHNPVDWYPWGEEALSKARTENKPILVSIGYSACHWCHVMERESFENERIAEVMNAHYICVKIDREERPDIDAIYMDALHAMGARGGWPLNVFLMPDTRPFYGLTYLPPQNWMQLLHSVQNAFENHLEDLEKSATSFTQNMLFKDTEKYGLEGGETDFEAADLDTMFEQMKAHFDTEKGGMDRAPKFPMPSIYKFLMRYYALTQNPEALQQIELSLSSIALGGIYDHVGGGWARYSVDDEWFIPHFEKMLYDNGQLLSIYSEAYTLFNTLDPSNYGTVAQLYKARVYQTIEWLEREMMSQEGGFYSALDADSEGVEGKFYVWTEEELRTVLGDEFEAFASLYNISKKGNWEHGYNHLHLTPTHPLVLDGTIRQKLFEARKARIHPGLDDKILASWNGLVLKGLTDAYRAFGDEHFKELALKNARFLKEKMMINTNQLVHSYKPQSVQTKEDTAPPPAFLEDYAAVIEAFIGLYQATFAEEWLDGALQLMAYTVQNFYDLDDELFYFTDKNAEELIARKKEIFDNVIPASNSTMAHNLYLLGTIFEHEDYRRLADWMLSKMKRAMFADVQWATNWAALYTLRAQPTAEIALVGPEIDTFRKALEQKFLPNKILVGTLSASSLPLLEGRSQKNNNEKSNPTTIYVCYDKTCNLPVFSVKEAWGQLEK